MLYLLLQETRDRDYYKVGYASDLDKRLRMYEDHCPFTKRVLEKNGNLYEEAILHKYLHTFSDIEFVKDEWYSVKPGDTRIKNLFQDTLDSMKETIWNSRKDYKLFSDNSKLDVKIYKELCSTYCNVNKNDPILSSLLKEEFSSNIQKIEKYLEVMNNESMSNEVREFYLWFAEQKDSKVKLQGYVEFLEMYPLFLDQVRYLCTLIPQEYYEVYSKLGADRIRGYGFQMSRLKDILVQDPISDIKNSMVSEFNVGGDRISNKEIKIKIQKIYDNLGLKKKAKASDLENYFECQKTNIVIDGKPSHGIKILSLK